MESGDAIGGHDLKVGTTDTAQECIDLVLRNATTANGITYVIDGDCYAEYGATSINSQACTEETCQTCIFEGKLLR